MAVQAAWRGFTVRAELRRDQLAATSIQVRHMSHFKYQSMPFNLHRYFFMPWQIASVLLDPPKLTFHHHHSCMVAKKTIRLSNCGHGGSVAGSVRRSIGCALQQSSYRPNSACWFHMPWCSFRDTCAGGP